MATTNVPAKGTYVDAEGDVYVDGLRITPAQAVQAASAVDKVWREASNKANWNLKNAERVLVYAATFVTTSNVFGQIPLSTGVKASVLGGAAFILGAIHVSSPKAN